MKISQRVISMAMAGLLALGIPAMAAAEPTRSPAIRPPGKTPSTLPLGHHHHRHWGPWWGWGWGPSVGINLNYPSGDEYLAAMLLAQQQQAAMQQAQAIAFQQGQMSAQQASHIAPQQPKPKPPAQRTQPTNLTTNAPTTAPVVLTGEERAANKLKLAMRLDADGKAADAAEYCNDIIQKYPGTPAAMEAQQYLEKSKNR